MQKTVKSNIPSFSGCLFPPPHNTVPKYGHELARSCEMQSCCAFVFNIWKRSCQEILTRFPTPILMSPQSFFCCLWLIVFGGAEFNFLTMQAFLTMCAFTFAICLLENVVTFVITHSSDGHVPGARNLLVNRGEWDLLINPILPDSKIRQCWRILEVFGCTRAYNIFNRESTSF